MTTAVPARARTTTAPYSFSELPAKRRPITRNFPSFIKDGMQKDRTGVFLTPCAGWNACQERLRFFQKREPPFPNVGKFRKILLGHRVGRRQTELLEVLVLALLQNTEIQMRSGGEAGAAYEPDGLSDFDVLARANVAARQVEIHRFVAVRMADVDHIPFSALRAGEHNPAAPNGLHRRPDGRAIIRAHVRANDF